MENDNLDPKSAERESQLAIKEAEKLSSQVIKAKIRKEADLEIATELLSQIKTTLKEVEKKRKTITQPLNLALKNINSLFKEPADKLKDAEGVLKTAILDYQERIEKRAEKRIGKIEDQVDSGDLEMSDAMDKLSNVNQGFNQVNTESGGVHFQVRKNIKIEDVSKLPPKYFLRDSVLEALRKEVSADVKAGIPIPDGAIWVEEKSVVARTVK